MFPIIQREIERLEEMDRLRFVPLDLEEMSRHQESPEGHQWGAAHHRTVGEQLARAILTADSSSR